MFTVVLGSSGTTWTTLLKQRQVTAHVRFRDGATTTLTLPRPLTAWEASRS